MNFVNVKVTITSFCNVARQYDPVSGRFLSVDPLFESFVNYSPYHYAYNNPISFKDPTGLAPEEEQGEEEQSKPEEEDDIAGEKYDEADEIQKKKDKPDEIQIIILDTHSDESWAVDMGLVTEMEGVQAAFQGSINNILNFIENILGGGGGGSLAGNSHNYSGIGTSGSSGESSPNVVDNGLSFAFKWLCGIWSGTDDEADNSESSNSETKDSDNGIESNIVESEYVSANGWAGPRVDGAIGKVGFQVGFSVNPVDQNEQTWIGDFGLGLLGYHYSKTTDLYEVKGQKKYIETIRAGGYTLFGLLSDIVVEEKIYDINNDGTKTLDRQNSYRIVSNIGCSIGWTGGIELNGLEVRMPLDDRYIKNFDGWYMKPMP